MSLRPFFPYYGSAYMKAAHYPAPMSDEVYEACAGALGYSTYYGVGKVRAWDVDPIIVGVWDFLCGASAGEIAALPEMPEVGDNVDNYAIPQEARWLIGFWLNRGSATPKKSRTAYSARTDRAQLNWGAKAKDRIIAQLPALADWKVSLGSYDQAPDVETTWFIDPPYKDKGRYYRFPLTNFGNLARWTLARRGLTLVCEASGADWLPFRPLGSFKSTRGRSDEVAFISGVANDLLAPLATLSTPAQEGEGR